VTTHPVVHCSVLGLDRLALIVVVITQNSYYHLLVSTCSKTTGSLLLLDVARYVEMLYYQSFNLFVVHEAVQYNSKCAIVASEQDEQGYGGALTAS